MADLKITDLGAALSVGDSNVTVLDDGSSTMKVTMTQLKQYSVGTTDISGIGNGTVTGAISSVNTSKNDVRNSIAPTETSTASRAYEVDEKMYISDVLYKATRAIALGDPLVSGTNITPANDVSTEILELKSDASEAIDSVKNIIAPVEDGGTAVLSYSVGDQFIHLGALCKAKTTINAGDTFIINTNYVDAGQVVDQLDSVKQALSDEVVTRSTLGAHNLLPNVASTEVNNGVTFTINADKSVTVSTGAGGATADATLKVNESAKIKLKKGKYVIKASPAGATTNGYYAMFVVTKNGTWVGNPFIRDSDVELVVGTGSGEWDVDEGYLLITVKSGTVISTPITYYPMVTLATDPYTEYTPYVPTNAQLLSGDTNAILGAHNFLRNEIQSQVSAPITFTRNADESVHISGTMTTSDSAVGVYVSNDTFLKAGTYEISGIPESIQGGYGYIQAYVTTTGGTIGWEDRGGNKGHEIHTFTEDTHVKVILSIYNLNNQTFNFDYKPMIKMVSDPSKEYQPYAKTNRELTDDVTTASGAFTVPSTYATSAQVIFNRQGRIATVTWSGSAPIFPAQATDYEIGSIPTGFTPKSNLMLFATDMNSFTKGMYLQLKTDGTVHICGYGTGTNGSINGFPSGAYLTN